MKHLVLFLVSFFMTSCSACIEQDQLVRLECLPGTKQVCDHHGNVHESLNPDNAPNLPGQCSYGFRTCTTSGWGVCEGAIGPSEEVCDGLDNDCISGIDDTFPEEHQLCGFVENVDYGVGICTPGVMKCDSGYLFCDGHVGPSEEACDGLDNNCNGSVDEGIANTTAVVCYEGPDGTMAIGECRAGVRYCTDGGFDGPCDGQKLPSEERCDDLDNDCDGEVDEGFDTRGVDLVFVLDISGSFRDEIESMVEGITPLLDDPITSTFRFGLVVVGAAPDREPRQHYMYSRMVSNFVPADEFLEMIEAGRMIQSAGMEPTIDTMFWTMQTYPFSWRPGAQKVIITMTDEEAQTVIPMSCHEVETIANNFGYELFIFALEQHHNTFRSCVGGDNDRLFTPAVNSETVFLQIRQIFEDLCIGR